MWVSVSHQVDSLMHESLRDHGRREFPLVTHYIVSLNQVQSVAVETTQGVYVLTAAASHSW